ncbi:MAG: efflux RND transporter periplasmic adaptor subunit [Deltaproteobacteria bacterium]|nr:efflux RND transporter periplasmic adaptor subunit [Deltaproteobacteria bacterium]MBW2069749.1 efflux RND transporter periplasmic adaptor subunit [Deltaproteobacteria bacterium]
MTEPNAEKRKYRKKSFIVIGIIAAVTVLASATIILRRPTVEPVRTVAPLVLPVRAVQVRQQPFQRSMTLYGSAEPLVAADVAAEIQGNIVWISPRCEPGEKVKQGEVLVRLDPALYEIALQQAEAALVEAQAGYDLQNIDNALQEQKLRQRETELRISRKELQRKKKLRERSAISSSAYDEQVSALAQMESSYLEQRARVEKSKALLARAEAEVKLAKARRAQAALDLARTEIKSPLDGVVARRFVELGNRLAVNEAAFRVVDYHTVVVEVQVPSNKLDLLRKGVEVEVRALNGELLRRGELRHLSPQADLSTRLFAAKVYVENPPGAVALLPGQFVTVVMKEKRAASSFVIPVAAIGQDNEGEYVFVVDNSSEARARKVYIKNSWQQEEVCVVHGLSEGQVVVVQGQENLVDGAPVKVISLEKVG